MIKYYYASITDKNIYIEDQNLLEYLNAYFLIYQDIMKIFFLKIVLLI